MKLFIDLFSGLGGSYQAFIETHQILAIDNNPVLLEHNDFMILGNIANTGETLQQIFRFIRDSYQVCMPPLTEIIIWASPPCVQYSTANINRNPDDFDNTLLEASLTIIHTVEKWLNPRIQFYWVVENVKGAYQEFSKIIGHTPISIGNKFFLWGKFPKFNVKLAKSHSKIDPEGSRALRPNLRAVIPYEISQGLKNSIRTQKTLF
jgi:site-specific DNA-cytosine methylase